MQKARSDAPVPHAASLLRERRSQLRGLLIVAAAILLFILLRARTLHMFHPGWWRL